MLVKDYSIQCSTEKHRAFQIIAGVYVVLVALGIPIFMAALMVRRMREYGGGSGSDRFVARRVADELKIGDDMAADAVRDCNTGREYSFLVNAFKPRYYYCESRNFPLCRLPLALLAQLLPALALRAMLASPVCACLLLVLVPHC